MSTARTANYNRLRPFRRQLVLDLRYPDGVRLPLPKDCLVLAELEKVQRFVKNQSERRLKARARAKSRRRLAGSGTEVSESEGA